MKIITRLKIGYWKHRARRKREAMLSLLEPADPDSVGEACVKAPAFQALRQDFVRCTTNLDFLRARLARQQDQE